MPVILVKKLFKNLLRIATGIVTNEIKYIQIILNAELLFYDTLYCLCSYVAILRNMYEV